MNQREIQVWNNAVEACRRAAWAEVEAMEREEANGMPNPARSVVRAVGMLHKQGDERNFVTSLTADDFLPDITT